MKRTLTVLTAAAAFALVPGTANAAEPVDVSHTCDTLTIAGTGDYAVTVTVNSLPIDDTTVSGPFSRTYQLDGNDTNEYDIAFDDGVNEPFGRYGLIMSCLYVPDPADVAQLEALDASGEAAEAVAHLDDPEPPAQPDTPTVVDTAATEPDPAPESVTGESSPAISADAQELVDTVITLLGWLWLVPVG